MFKTLLSKKAAKKDIPTYRKYSYAVIATCFCLALEWLLNPLIGSTQYFLLYPLSFLMAAAFGFGPAVAVILFGGLGTNLVLTDPLNAPSIFNFSFSFSKFMIFFLTAFSSSFLIYLVLQRQRLLEASIHRLEEADKQFKILADSSPVLVWMVNINKETSWVNKNWTAYTGKNVEETRSTSLIHKDDEEFSSKTFNENFDEQKEFKIEHRLLGKNGEYRWFLCNGTPMFSGSDFCGFVGTCVDIHELKVAEEKIKKAVSSRDQFLSMASHELKTPLATLSLQAQVFKRAMEKGQVLEKEQIVKITDQLTRQVFRIARLIDDMLDNSRINSGKFGVHPEQINLGEVAEEVVERVQNEFANIKEKSTIINYTLKDSEDKFNGYWDKLKIEQVLANLLTNAIKYGGNNPVDVVLEDHDDRVVIAVTDKGAGIEEEEKEKIFQRFYRIHGPSDSGLGLGLFISKQIVKAHNGKIWVESEKGQGSTFKVELPKFTNQSSEEYYV